VGDNVLLSRDGFGEFLNVFSIPRALASAADTICEPHLATRCDPPRGEPDLDDALYTSEWTMSMGNAVLALSDGFLNPDGVELKFYRMVDLSSLSEPMLPSVLPIKVGEATLPDWYQFLGGASIHRMSADLAMLGVVGRDAVAIAKFTMPDPSHNRILATSVKFLTDEAAQDDGNLYGQAASVCVATGRLVVASPSIVDEDGQWRRQGEVKVLDYLSST
jgi:hypothetical protein